MTTSFPGSVDNFGTNPTPTSPRNSPSLANSIANLNDAVTAVETALGANLSKVVQSTTIPVFSSGTIAARPAFGTAGRLYLATDVIALYRDTGAAWTTLMTGNKTLRIPHTFAVSGAIAIASADVSFIPPFFVPIPAGTVSATIVAMRAKIRGGTSCTIAVQKNGGNVTGINGVTVTPTAATFTATAGNTLADGDQVAVVVTGTIGSPDGLSASVYVDYTF